MHDQKTENRNTLKYRIALILSFVVVAYYYYSMSDLITIIVCSVLAAIISALTFMVIVKFDLAHKKYLQGIGAIVFVVFSVFWKKIHIYSIKIEMTIALIAVITGVILSFKYSASELEGK